MSFSVGSIFEQSGAFLTDITEGLGTLAEAAAPIIGVLGATGVIDLPGGGGGGGGGGRPRNQPTRQPAVMPGGTFTAPQTGFQPVSMNVPMAQPAFFGLDVPGFDIVGQGMGQLSSMFRPTRAGASAQTFVVPNPATGRPTWFKPAGRPVLWSGDLSAARRVKKVAARARRAGGR